jgi:type IV pilus assembly protein PilE
MTLIEILVVVTIIGILGTVAIPSYSKFVTQQRRADAHHLLQANAQRLQRCLTLAGAFNNCNTVNESRERHYSLKSTLTVQTWTLTAEPASDSPQRKDSDCKTITLTNTGIKGATGDKPSTCW